MGAAAPVRLGFLGAGTISRIHLAAFARVPGVGLAGIASGRRERAEEAARLAGVARVYDTPEQLLAAPEIDAVVISTPNRWHEPLAVAALQAGKHVLVEKPLATTAAGAERIWRAQQVAGKCVLVAHQRRWTWSALQLRRQAVAGDFGRIYHAKTIWNRRQGIPGWGSWFTRREEAGGGALLDIGVHVLDLALWLMGGPRPVAVSGVTHAGLGPRRKGAGTWGQPDWNGIFDVEDLAAALIRLEDGRTLALETAWAGHQETDNQPGVHLLGTEGGAVWRGDGGKIFTEQLGHPMEAALVPPPHDEGAAVRLARHFAECVRGEAVPQADARSGLVNNLVIEAIYESARTGREVPVLWPEREGG